MKNFVKYLHQITWHIFPMSVVFFILMGFHLFVIFLIATRFFMVFDAPGELDGSWVPIAGVIGGMILISLFNAFVPSVILFLIALTLDRLTKNRPIWLKIVLPFPFILALTNLVLAFILYTYFSAGIPTYSWWLSLINLSVILLVALLVVIFALFTPYWYGLQTQRFLIWLVMKFEDYTESK